MKYEISSDSPILPSFSLHAENRVIIKGNTYPVREALKALGGRWNPKARYWTVPACHAAEAEDLVQSAEVLTICWECGGRYTPAEMADSPYGQWDGWGWHCGC